MKRVGAATIEFADQVQEKSRGRNQEEFADRVRKKQGREVQRRQETQTQTKRD